METQRLDGNGGAVVKKVEGLETNVETIKRESIEAWVEGDKLLKRGK